MAKDKKVADLKDNKSPPATNANNISSAVLAGSSEENSTKLLFDKARGNIDKEIRLDGVLLGISAKIDWLNSNISYLKRKVNNNEWCSNDSKFMWPVIEDIRKQYSKDKELADKDYAKWIQDKAQERIKALEAEYAQVYQKLSGETKITRPIVWGMTGRELTAEGYKDSSYYVGKNPTKRVYIPFSAIHGKLAEANWIMRGGRNPKANYLLGHLLFVVSNEKHEKNANGKYVGNRTYFDFPLVSPLALIAQNRQFKSEQEYQEFLTDDQQTQSLGQYPDAIYGRHSEPALAHYLKENAQNIVLVLQNKLRARYGNCEGYKVYNVSLFLNSQKNVCGGVYGDNCEGVLNTLMTSHENGSFLHLLKQALTIQKLKVPKSNDGFPGMFITVSSHEYYGHYCCTSLTDDASNELLCMGQTDAPNFYNLTLNIKKCAGSIILGVAKFRIDGSELYEDKEQMDADEKIKVATLQKQLAEPNGKRPFYSGFRSASGSSDLLSVLGHKVTRYCLPMCFDGNNIITLQSAALATTSLQHGAPAMQTIKIEIVNSSSVANDELGKVGKADDKTAAHK